MSDPPASLVNGEEVVVALEEIIRVDDELRARFRDGDQPHPEWQLMRQLVERSQELLPDFPYLVGHEWEPDPGRTDHGRGDLLFYDGGNRYAVVEVKAIDPSSGATSRRRRNRQRSEVYDQARRYARGFGPDKIVVAFVFTNDDPRPVPVPLDESTPGDLS